MNKDWTTKTENSIQDYIQLLTNAIIEKVQPEKIVLFGSHAYGEPTPSSDIDILVIVKDSVLNQSERVGILYTQLKHLSKYPKDLVVYTLEEVKKWENVRQAFITSIVQKGRVLYEREN